MSYPWHMAFSGILVDTALEFRTSMHSLSLLYHSFWIFQPVSLVNNWFSISLHDQRCHPVCHDHMEQARGWPTRKLPPTNLSNVSLRLIPVAIVIFRYVLVCHAVHCQNIGGERPLWRIVSFQVAFNVERDSSLFSIPWTPVMLLFAESLHGKWVPHLLHLRHQPHLPSLQRPGGVIQVLPNKNNLHRHKRPIDINDNVPRGKSTL